MKTEFAAAEKATEDEIKRQHQNISANPEIQRILDAMPDSVMILNKERQIVYANKETLSVLGVESIESLFGLRPGDSLKCIHANESENGCGTTKYCRFCGAVNAILASQIGKVATEECRIIRSDNGTAMDLKIKASPFTDNGVDFTVFAISDISAEKRKEVLESIFFHDIMNTAGGLYGFSELLVDAEPKEADEYKVIIHKLSERIVDEINAQRQLLQAENGQLDSSPEMVDALVMLKNVVEVYSRHELAKEKTIEIDHQSQSLEFRIDKTLLSRILGNLVKNALEASKNGQIVSVACRLIENEVEFQVSNQSVMPEQVQMKIFQRSFSTKGKGRGLGTYSIKLLTEKYLGGKVHFISDEERGTQFFARFPVDPQ